MGFAVGADYLGGHPEFERPLRDGELRLDEESRALTFSSPLKPQTNPVDLTVEMTERFVVPLDELESFALSAADTAGALAAAARGSIFLGAWGAASALDSHRGSHLNLGVRLNDQVYRLAFMVNELAARELLARVDARRAAMGSSPLNEMDEVPPAFGTEVLAAIAQRLEENGQMLAAILERLPPRGGG